MAIEINTKLFFYMCRYEIFNKRLNSHSNISSFFFDYLSFFTWQVRIMTLSINATEPYSRDDLVVRSGMLARLCPDTYTLIDLN